MDRAVAGRARDSEVEGAIGFFSAARVIVENIGEGSEYAVPIFRAMIESYYYGSPQRIYYDFGIIGEPPYTPTPPGGFVP